MAEVRRQRDSLDKASLVAYEIAEVRGDTLFLRQGNKRGPWLQAYQLPEIRKAALEFLSSGNSFASEAKPFTRPWPKSPQRLESPSLPDVNVDVKYVIRPGS